ncbi:MAG: hypothetical protein ACXWL9_03145, partial [Syntrophales bacterium]
QGMGFMDRRECTTGPMCQQNKQPICGGWVTKHHDKRQSMLGGMRSLEMRLIEISPIVGSIILPT